MCVELQWLVFVHCEGALVAVMNEQFNSMVPDTYVSSNGRKEIVKPGHEVF